MPVKNLGFGLGQIFWSRHMPTFIVLDFKFDFESGASAEQQADDPFIIFGGFIMRGFP